MSNVTSNALLTDIFTMIRSKLIADSTISGIVSSRVYQSSPPKNVTYPAIIIAELPTITQPDNFLWERYLIRIDYKTLNMNHADRDSVVSAIRDIFNAPGACFNQGVTKFDRVSIVSKGSYFFDQNTNLHNYGMTLELIARMKGDIFE